MERRGSTSTLRLLKNSRFSSIPTRELAALSVALLVLGISFSVRHMGILAAFTISATAQYLEILLLTMVVIGTGFVGHELAHKFTAQRYGCWAEFRLWTYGAVMALLFAIVSQGNFIFAAPGAVYIASRSSFLGEGIDRRANGIISIVGPVVNLLAAAAFTAVLVSTALVFGARSLPVVGDFNFLRQGVYVNLVLGAFNMLPIFMLDGQKVFTWDKKIWAVLSVPLWVAVFTVPGLLENWLRSLPS